MAITDYSRTPAPITTRPPFHERMILLGGQKWNGSGGGREVVCLQKRFNNNSSARGASAIIQEEDDKDDAVVQFTLRRFRMHQPQMLLQRSSSFKDSLAILSKDFARKEKAAAAAAKARRRTKEESSTRSATSSSRLLARKRSLPLPRRLGQGGNDDASLGRARKEAFFGGAKGSSRSLLFDGSSRSLLIDIQEEEGSECSELTLTASRRSLMLPDYSYGDLNADDDDPEPDLLGGHESPNSVAVLDLCKAAAPVPCSLVCPEIPPSSPARSLGSMPQRQQHHSSQSPLSNIRVQNKKEKGQGVKAVPHSSSYDHQLLRRMYEEVRQASIEHEQTSNHLADDTVHHRNAGVTNDENSYLVMKRMQHDVSQVDQQTSAHRNALESSRRRLKNNNGASAYSPPKTPKPKLTKRASSRKKLLRKACSLEKLFEDIQCNLPPTVVPTDNGEQTTTRLVRLKVVNNRPETSSRDTATTNNNSNGRTNGITIPITGACAASSSSSAAEQQVEKENLAAAAAARSSSRKTTATTTTTTTGRIQQDVKNSRSTTMGCSSSTIIKTGGSAAAAARSGGSSSCPQRPPVLGRNNNNNKPNSPPTTAVVVPMTSCTTTTTVVAKVRWPPPPAVQVPVVAAVAKVQWPPPQPPSNHHNYSKQEPTTTSTSTKTSTTTKQQRPQPVIVPQVPRRGKKISEIVQRLGFK